MDVSFDADLAVTADHVYVLTGGGSDEPVRLWRMAKRDLSEQVLAEAIPSFSQITVASDRVYLYGGGQNLWTRTEDGELVDEGFEVDSIASSAGVVYADQQGTLAARPDGESTWTPQPWLANEPGSAHLLPIDVSDRLCVLREFPEGWGRYELFLVDRPELPDGGLLMLASGSGEVLRIRSQRGMLYWLVREETGLHQLLRRDLEVESRIQVLATGSQLGDDFALDTAHVYLTGSTMIASEFEVLSSEPIGRRLALGISFDMWSPESDGSHLWFFGRGGLGRIELPVGEP